ncbi:MAG TPA: DUF6716 putative glycosyltransferase, partial [Microbacterium sp.]|nr:DUF6716 putative glycosyltransferase [Microbacterium sp.]
DDRRRIAEILRLAAVADPARRVVVKLRSRTGEVEAHQERDGYTELLENAPDNLVFSFAPMAEALATAEGLVTVSSTAAIEAMAAGVPVIALDEFGVRPELLNGVFADSGLLGGADDVVARRFRHPNPRWATTNYFHDPRDSRWWEQTQRLVAQRRRGTLPARTVPRARGGALHEAWHRRNVLGAEDRSISGRMAGVIVTPVIALLASVKRRRGAVVPDAMAADFTLAQSPVVEPVGRLVGTRPRL